MLEPFSSLSPPPRPESEETLDPKFDARGLIPAIAQHAETGEVLMLAWMDAEALARTLATREAWYWSRSRGALWRKGATSGQVQRVEEVRIDCDQDAVLLRVVPQGDGGCCHLGPRTCFHRRVEGAAATARLHRA